MGHFALPNVAVTEGVNESRLYLNLYPGDSRRYGSLGTRDSGISAMPEPLRPHPPRAPTQRHGELANPMMIRPLPINLGTIYLYLSFYLSLTIVST